MNKEISVDVDDLVDGVVSYQPVEQRNNVFYNQNYSKRLFVQDYQLYSFRRVGDNISKSLVDIEWEHHKDFSSPIALLPDFDSMNPYREQGQKKRVPLESIIKNIMGSEFDHGEYYKVYKKKLAVLQNKKYEIKEIDLASYPVKSVFSFRDKIYKNYILVKTDKEYVLLKCVKNEDPQLQKQKLIGYGKEAYYYLNYEGNNFCKVYQSKLKFMVVYNTNYTNTLVKKWDKFIKIIKDKYDV